MNLLDGMGSLFFFSHNVFVIIVMGGALCDTPIDARHQRMAFRNSLTRKMEVSAAPTFIYKGQSVETDDGQLYSNREENELLMN